MLRRKFLEGERADQDLGGSNSRTFDVPEDCDPGVRHVRAPHDRIGPRSRSL